MRKWEGLTTLGSFALAAWACSSPFSAAEAGNAGAGGNVTSSGGKASTGGSEQPAAAGQESGGTPSLPDGGNAADGGSNETPTGGTAGTGGAGSGGTVTSAGSGGMPAVCKPATGPKGQNKCGHGPWPAGDGTHFLIDNFEDGDSKINALDNREGLWAFVTDGTGTTLPPDPSSLAPSAGGAEQSKMALHVKGQSFAKWGATLILPFRGVCPYDAKNYGGIEFLAKGSGKLAVEVRDEQLTPVAFGGVCVEESDAQCCADYPAKELVLTSAWQKFSYQWADLKQPGIGYRAQVDAATLVALSLNPRGADFELWIDNIAFLPAK